MMLSSPASLIFFLSCGRRRQKSWHWSRAGVLWERPSSYSCGWSWAPAIEEKVLQHWGCRPSHQYSSDTRSMRSRVLSLHPHLDPHFVKVANNVSWMWALIQCTRKVKNIPEVGHVKPARVGADVDEYQLPARHKYRGSDKHVRSTATKASSVCVA